MICNLNEQIQKGTLVSRQTHLGDQLNWGRPRDRKSIETYHLARSGELLDGTRPLWF